MRALYPATASVFLTLTLAQNCDVRGSGAAANNSRYDNSSPRRCNLPLTCCPLRFPPGMFLEARDAVMGVNDTVLERELLPMQPAAAMPHSLCTARCHSRTSAPTAARDDVTGLYDVTLELSVDNGAHFRCDPPIPSCSKSRLHNSRVAAVRSSRRRIRAPAGAQATGTTRTTTIAGIACNHRAHALVQVPTGGHARQRAHAPSLLLDRQLLSKPRLARRPRNLHAARPSPVWRFARPRGPAPSPLSDRRLLSRPRLARRPRSLRAAKAPRLPARRIAWLQWEARAHGTVAHRRARRSTKIPHVMPPLRTKLLAKLPGQRRATAPGLPRLRPFQLRPAVR